MNAKIDSPATHELIDSSEERILLWKITRLLVEHDGVSSGSVVGLARDLLLPQDKSSDQAEPETQGRSKMLDEVNEGIYQHLLRGEREQAAWYAADRAYWGHAMLIASKSSSDPLLQRVAEDFIKKEINPKTMANRPLAMLLHTFAGNMEDSIDILVPPSARAGLRMVSATDGLGESQDPLDSLDQWREALCLLLSNRSPAIFGGNDDSSAHFAILGSTDPRDVDSILLSEVYEFALGLAPGQSCPLQLPHLQAYKLHHAIALAEAGLRNEALQYCEAINAGLKASTRASPYNHAILATEVDNLSRRLSQTKDSSSSWLPKPSMAGVSGSFLSKFNSFVTGGDEDQQPSLQETENDLTPFNSFGGGTPTISRSPSVVDLYGAPQQPTAPSSRYAPQRHQQQDLAAVQSVSTRGPQEHRPVLEQSFASYGFPSNNPLSQLSASPPQPQPQLRYAPSRQNLNMVANTAPVTPDVTYPGYPTPSVAEIDRPSSISAFGYGAPASDDHGKSATPYSTRANVQADQTSAIDTSHASSYPYQPHQKESTHTPYDPVTTDQHPQPEQFSYQSSAEESSYQPSEPQDPQYMPNASGAASYLPHEAEQSSYQPYEPGTSSYQPYEPGEASYQPYEPDTSSYQPHEPGGASYQPYEPGESSYQPYEPGAEQDYQQAQARSSNAPSAPAFDDADEVKRREKAEKDRIADEAVRKAAEADAARDKAGAEKKGWFGGWLGGAKKDANAPTVYRAKLGEESSFYFDKETQKWVNKKAGASPASTPAAAPPPRGPPMSTPRLSGSAGPSRVTTPALSTSSAQATGTPPIDRPPTISAAAPTAGASKPSMPSADIDDLLGPRKGATAKKGKKGGSRYVDVMAK
ncbi:hypothetical protein MRB53_038705 [Persea americana]|nr:hypothetical protein MRB53_038705 [Persea americana]